MALITVTEAKEFLRLTENEYDVLIENLITRASAIIEKHCGRTFASTQYTEIYDGTGDPSLMLDNCPIISLDEYSEDFDVTPFAIHDDVDVTAFLLQKASGIIFYSEGDIPVGAKNIYVKYTAGYAAIPEDVKQVCVELVAKKFKDSEYGQFGLASKSVMSENITFGYQDINSFMKDLLEKYTKSGQLRGATLGS